MAEIDLIQGLMSANFASYVIVALFVYAIRQATSIPNKYIPLLSIAIGIALAILELKGFNYEVLKTGVQNALWAIGTVAGLKYAQESRKK
ncbi:phage holin family protein [Priestia megaterium]|uniref:phage holin family protein n=1 Tax=Priestia megaterium TaxID=1404 RepID=UPI00112E8DFB|nr:phage holin family protein [Priestia megaterium]TPF17909.1 hypothetical protein CBE78_01425 [Priestia megaterium]TPF22017.1 hypothetical protein CBE79_03930 [Priestia megaterium]